MGISKKKSAFTLAETLIVLVVLGIIASLTIPSLVKRQYESQNRTKIKKAMTMYDTTIQKMVIENGIKSDTALTNWADDDCSNTSAYFKIAEGSGCQFKTSDGIWWDIGTKGSLMKPIVAFKKADLDADKAGDANDNEAFYFVTKFDENTGAFRTDDAQYISSTGSDDQKAALSKLFAYINNEATSSSDPYAAYSAACTCSEDGIMESLDESNLYRSSTCKACTSNITIEDIDYQTIYDKNGNLLYGKACFENEGNSICSSITLDNTRITEELYESSDCPNGFDDSVCSKINYSYNSNGLCENKKYYDLDCNFQYQDVYINDGEKVTYYYTDCDENGMNCESKRQVYEWDANGNSIDWEYVTCSTDDPRCGQ